MKRTFWIRSMVTLFVGLLFHVACIQVVRAQSQEGEDAESLIHQGIQLRRKGDDLRAHGYFKRAYEIAHTPRAAAQLGFVEQALNRMVEAQEHLSEALANADAWVDEKRDLVQQSLDTVHAALGRIQINLGVATPAGVTIQINKRRLTKLPSDGAVWVEPGDVALQIDAPDYSPATREMTVGAGQSLTADFALARSHKAPAPPVSLSAAIPPSSESQSAQAPSGQTSEARNWKTPAKWAAAGMAVAALGLGVFETLHYNSKVNAFDAAKDPTDPSGKTPLCSEDNGVISGGNTCLKINDDEKSARLWAVIGFSAGAALAITSAALFVVDRKHADTGVALSCVPGIAANNWMSCRLRF